MVSQDRNTEEKIFDAAKEVFTEKGFDGSRMEEISERAGINKALLHYYYRTKEKLFNTIFEKVMGDFLKQVIQVMTGDAPLFEKIEYFVNTYITFIMRNPLIPSFIINELNRNPKRVVSIFESTPLAKSQAIPKLAKAIQAEVEKGTIEPIEPEQLIVNLIALSVFPIIARPIIQPIIFNDDKKKYNDFLEHRKKEVARFIINAIRKKDR